MAIHRQPKVPEKEKHALRRRRETTQETQDRISRRVSAPQLRAAVSNPKSAPPVVFESLQRLYGNRAISRLIQTKLTVGAAHDPYEQEADRVAGQVMRAPETALSVQRAGEEDELQLKPLAAAITPLVQRQSPEEEEPIQAKRLQRAEEDELQTKPLVQRQSPEEDELQTKPDLQRANADGSFEAGTEFEQKLDATRGGGAPLPDDTRQFMESRFSADFGGVRVHADSSAVQLNRDVQAQAFTHGQDIYFGAGKYNPSSDSGKQLLAHELTHVIQQTGADTRVQRQDHKDTGLKKEAAIERFSKKVKARVTGARKLFGLGAKREWKTLTAQQRADKLVKYVNAELKKTHAPEIKGMVLTPGGAFGNATFDFQTWNITLDDAGLDQDLTDDQIGELGDAIYHESRHSEQWFRMARLKAGEGLDNGQIATNMFIPADIAQAAVDRPLKPLSKTTRMLRRRHFVERQDAKLQEAKDWHKSVYGADSAHRNQVLSDINNRYGDYRALSEEVDAWAVGGAAGQKIKDLLKNA